MLLRSDKTLSLSFEISVMEVRGGLNLAVPVAVSHALLRKISAEQSSRRPRGRSDWRERLKRLLLDCPFAVELGVSGLSAPFGDISALAPGQLLPLSRSVGLPASLLVAGVEMFRASPARSAETRAAQVIGAAEESNMANAMSARIEA